MGILSGTFWYFCNFSVKLKLFQNKKLKKNPSVDWVPTHAVATCSCDVGAVWAHHIHTRRKVNCACSPLQNSPVYLYQKVSIIGFFRVLREVLVMCGQHINPLSIPFVIITPVQFLSWVASTYTSGVSERAGWAPAMERGIATYHPSHRGS